MCSGRRAPAQGGESLLREESPLLGEEIPLLGEESPLLGEESPLLGEEKTRQISNLSELPPGGVSCAPAGTAW